jgi:hypothetical protein
MRLKQSKHESNIQEYSYILNSRIKKQTQKLETKMQTRLPQKTPIKTHFLKQSCSLFPILIKRAVYKVAYFTFLAFLVIFENY